MTGDRQEEGSADFGASVAIARGPIDSRTPRSPALFVSEDYERGPKSFPVLWERVEVGGDCWTWVGPISPNGYGRHKHQWAHRFMYELLRGPIPPGQHIDHLCLNRRCVRPSHLEPVSQAENNRRMQSLHTRCPRGHPLDGTRTNGTRRYCKTCARANAAAQYRKRTGS